MGRLSKKLGGGSTLVGGSTVAYKWSNQGYTVADILAKFRLPCVVQCVTDSCTVLWSDFQFDLRQPLLLYNRRTVRKVHARSIQRKPAAGGPVEEFGPPLAIPEDYDGWFSASPKGENQVHRHFRVQGVADSGVRRFLVTTKLPAFSPGRGADGGDLYKKHDVMPGEVLTRVYTMEADLDPPPIVLDHGPCLACMDEKDEPVLLPMNMRGILYEVADGYPGAQGSVFQISSVVKSGNSGLPRILTLVHGEPPVLAFTFTGMLRAYSVFTEETLLAGSLDSQDSMCLEMITDSAAKFRLGLNESAIKQTCEYINAQQICESFGPKFVVGIKVAFSLHPENPDGDDLDLSLFQQAADAQEVDAKSEFEFAWGSEKKANMLALNSESDDDGKKIALTPKSSTGSGNEAPVGAAPRELIMLGLSGMSDENTWNSSSSDMDSLKEKKNIDTSLNFQYQHESSLPDVSDSDSHSNLGNSMEDEFCYQPSVVEIDAEVHDSNQDAPITYRSAREYDSDNAQDSIESSDEDDGGGCQLDPSSYEDVDLTPAREFKDKLCESDDSMEGSIPDIMRKESSSLQTEAWDMQLNRDVPDDPTDEISDQVPCHRAARETALRLGHLIEEVTALVDRSTDRLTETAEQSTTLNSPHSITLRTDHGICQLPEDELDVTYDTDRSDKLPGQNDDSDNQPDSSNLIDYSDSDSCLDLPSKHIDYSDSDSCLDSPSKPIDYRDSLLDSSSSPKGHDEDKIDAAVSSISHDALDIENEPSVPLKKLSPSRSRKTKIQSAIHFLTGFGDSKSKSKSDDFSGALKRTSKQKNLPSASSEQHISDFDWMSRVHSQERLNRVLSRETAGSTNRFGSPKVTLYPHDHPHKHPHLEKQNKQQKTKDSLFWQSNAICDDHAGASGVTMGFKNSKGDQNNSLSTVADKVPCSTRDIHQPSDTECQNSSVGDNDLMSAKAAPSTEDYTEVYEGYV